jgi:hypothetical protein
MVPLSHIKEMVHPCCPYILKKATMPLLVYLMTNPKIDHRDADARSWFGDFVRPTVRLTLHDAMAARKQRTARAPRATATASSRRESMRPGQVSPPHRAACPCTRVSFLTRRTWSGETRHAVCPCLAACLTVQRGSYDSSFWLPFCFFLVRKRNGDAVQIVSSSIY